ncbi:hypothetical protein NQ314_002391 [Rhamnusium bicolor]|uniref:ISXO2-like transposase domain-containing protein n=1 Tax=Rhamnusium bicolor TaxID=1586634 RepID=A0AAV8ZRG3_9CUCU|nr:hypothetical protein NQ314_002391 [Rhamnusium bicolor]
MSLKAIENKRHSVFNRVKELLKIGQSALGDETKVMNFNLRFDGLSELVHTFESLHLEIVAMVDSDQLEVQDNIQAEFDTMHYSIKGIYHELAPRHSPVNSEEGSVRSLPQSIIGGERISSEFGDSELPSFVELYTFLQKRCRALETTVLTSNGVSSCKQATVSGKISVVNPKKQILSDGGLVKATSSFATTAIVTPVHKSSSDNSNMNKGDDNVVNVITSTVLGQSTVLFATAIVDIRDSNGRYHRCRALLDSASQASFVTLACAERMGLPRFSSNIPIQGVNQMTTSSTLGTVLCTVKPPRDPQFEVEMIVIPSIFAVEDRSAGTLVDIIKNEIAPGTTIFSDCWRAYDSLGENQYKHLTVNHSVNFVDLDTGTHTQNIEIVD